MHNFQELKMWQKGIDLAVKIYEKTLQFPNTEIYGITSQMRRSGVSIPSNIAEGAGRNTDTDFNKFLGYSVGSGGELFTQTIIAERVGLLTAPDSIELQNEITEIMKMTHAFRSQLRTKYPPR